MRKDLDPIRPQVIRGYASQLTAAINQDRTGSIIELDRTSAQAIKGILLAYATAQEVRQAGKPWTSKDTLGRLRVIVWNEENALVQHHIKILDPYLGVDEHDALEHVGKVLDIPRGGTIAAIPGADPRVAFVMYKSQCLAKIVRLPELENYA